MSNPKVSIIIPVYNGSNYLGEAIDSALAQTYEHTEVIVINDGSNDGGKTEEIALSYGSKIKYIIKANGGVASALNLGIKAAQGDYIAWLSHDDVFFPNKVTEEIRHVQNEQEPIVIFCDQELINDQSKYMGSRKIKGKVELPYALFSGFPLSGCAMLIPKVCFDKVGLFNETLPTTQDYEMWFRLVKEFRFKHIPRCLSKIRLHDEQGSVKLDVLNEKNNLYVWALDLFSPEEIFANFAGSYFIGYLGLSVRLEIMGAPLAARYARKLGARYMPQTPLSTRIYGYGNFAVKWAISLTLLKVKNVSKNMPFGRKLINILRKIST